MPVLRGLGSILVYPPRCGQGWLISIHKKNIPENKVKPNEFSPLAVILLKQEIRNGT